MKVKALGPINHDGETYQTGDTLDVSKETVQELIAAGAVADPNAPKVETKATDGRDADQIVADAEVRAKEIVSEATEAAKATSETAVADAKEQAAKVIEDAQAEAEKIKADATETAQKTVQDAQAEAEKIRTAAKPAKQIVRP